MFDLIAQTIRHDSAAGATGGTLEVDGNGVKNFDPAARPHLFSFAIGGEGTPEKKLKRVTAGAIRAWLRPYHGPNVAPRFVGWWVEDGVIVLDIPTIWSGTDYDQTRGQAVKIGRDRGERAIYDFTTGEDIIL